MRALALFLLAASAATAQTAAYPSAVVTDSQLRVAVNQFTVPALSLPIGSSDTSATVSNATGIVINSVVTIDNEHIAVCNVVGNVLSFGKSSCPNIDGRAFDSTSAASHGQGATVNLNIDAWHHNALAAEVKAIEGALGVGMANIPTLPAASAQLQYLRTKPNTGNNTTYQFASQATLYASDFNYPAITPTSPSSLTGGGGAQTITVPLCPQGIYGSSTWAPVYLSGGSGTAEAAIPSGGTCSAATLGIGGGTIIVSPVNSHSGAWTIQSASGGIQEAIQAAKTAGGGVVYTPPGTYSLTVAIQVPSNVTLAAAGQNVTILKVANGALAANTSWQIPGVAGVYCIVCLASGSSYEQIKDLTIDANGANQTWIYYGDITGYNASNVVIERVTVKNHPISGGTGVHFQFLGHSPMSANANNVIINSSSIGIANCTVPNGGGAYYIEGEGNRVISSYAVNFCDSPAVISLCDHCLIADSVFDVGSGQMSTPTQSIEGATNSTFQNNQCIGTGTNGHRYCVGVASIPLLQSAGNMVIGVSSSHASTALEIGQNNSAFGATTPILDTQVIGLHADNAALDCIVFSEYVNKVSITGGNLEGCGGSGISISSTGAIAGGKVVQNVVVNGLTIDHAVAYGVLAVNGTSGPPVNAITIVNSFIGDTYASPVQVRGIWFQAGLVSNAYIAGNTITGNTSNATLFQNTFDVTSVIANNPGASAATFTAANLGSASTAGPGAQRYCVDCTTAATCVTGGTGHMATSNGTIWQCQ